MSGLKMEEASGPDKTGNKILKTFKEVIEKPMTEIFNKMLEKVETPEQWDIVEIILLHKKGTKTCWTTTDL